MIQDLPDIMREQGVDCLVALGHETFCPEVHYLTRGAPISHCAYVLRAGERPHLVHTVIEADGAARVDADRSLFQDYGMNEIFAKTEDPLAATIELYRRMFEKLGVKGRVSLNGDIRLGKGWALMKGLQETAPGLEIAPEFHGGVLETARRTKDAEEIERIAAVGRSTKEIYARIESKLAGATRGGDGLLDEDGSRLTIGKVKREITRTAFERGLAEPHGTIFAQGRDAAVPHNHGEVEQVIRPGTALVADVYPQESGGGYFFDMTRTYCVGEAPDKLERLYGAVREATQLALAEIRPGEPSTAAQEKICEFFEKQGFETPRTHPSGHDGYVHSLGHGVGLEIHERPTLSHLRAGALTIEPGMVLTVEPGLYYPEEGFGVRLEDLVVVQPDGSLRNLTDYPYRLEIAAS
jgi:Xaa-Pro aminopeptidase